MKKKTSTKKWRAIWLSYYWLKIIGINPLSLSKDNELEFSWLSLVYGCSLTTTYIYISYCVFVERLKVILPGETPLSVITDFIAFNINFLEICSTWLVFGFHQNRIKCIVKGFLRAEKISSRLEIPENYDKHFTNLGITLIVVTIICLTWGILGNALKQLFDFHGFIWTCYFMFRVSTYNAGTLFLWSLIVAKHKFHRLNDKLRYSMRNHSARTNEINNCNSIPLSDRLNMISKLHRELRDVVHRVQRHYAALIFFNILTQFLNITVNVHIIYRYLKQQGRIKEIDIMYLGCVSFWVSFPLMWLIIISNVCGSTVEEANETGNILHAMINSCDNFNYAREAAKLKVISLDLLHNRVRLSLFGFFDLDHSLVYNTIAIATTYLIIMLQFYG